MDVLTGRVLAGRYRVEGFLGRGGMADVYKIWDEQRSAYLAMKVLHHELAEDLVLLRRFKREAVLLERLQHPNIVRFYGLEEADGLAFILMDYIDGLTLRKEIHLSKQGMRPERILQILRPVCAALHYAHQMGMVHCDIKPANIMIHRNSTVYLADFGIARFTEATTQTLPGAGTPAFMSPEQLLGQAALPASDVYALGVVLFEMITGGERPFTGEAAGNVGNTTQRIVWEKRHLPPPSPRKFHPQVSSELEQVVLRCLEREPHNRYASTIELLHALEEAVRKTDPDGDQMTLPDVEVDPAEISPPAYLSNSAAAYGPASSAEAGLSAPEPAALAAGASDDAPSRDGTSPLPLNGKITSGLLFVLLLILAVSVAAAYRQAAARAAIPTQTAAVSALQPMPSATTAAPTRPFLSPTPSSTGPATASPTPPDTPTPRPTPLGGGLPGSPGQIAFASDRSGSVQIWTMGIGGESRRQLTQVEGGACQPAWSPDGRQLVYTTPCNGPRLTYPGAHLQILDLDTGQTSTPVLKNGGFDPAWSPEGSTIAFTGLNGTLTEIHAYQLETAAETVLARRQRINANPAWSPDGERIVFTGDDLGVDVLWLMRKDGGSQEIFTQAGLLKYFTQPAWSPDGKTILTTMKELNVNVPILVTFEERDPGKGEISLLSEVFQMNDGAYAPDGQWIVFWTPMESSNLEIMRVNLAGEKVRLTNHPARDFHPAWRPVK